MSREQIMGIVRHVLTTVGGIIVSKGYADTSAVEAIVGGIVAVVGVVWSISKNKKES